MPRCFLFCFIVLSLSLAHAGSAKGTKICIQKNGVEMCTVDKGFFHSTHIFGQTSKYAMDGLYCQVVNLRVRNLSTRNIFVAPENFLGEAETGQRYAVDRSLHDSMNWPQKLTPKTLAPHETLEGDLIFPLLSSPVRKITHNGHPYMEIFLY